MLSHWETDHYRARYSSQMQKWVETLEYRLLPTFDNIKSETDQMLETLRSDFPDIENIDPFSAHEAMFEAAMNHYDMNLSVKQGLLNMFAAGLYHLFEQQVQEFNVKGRYRKRLSHASDVLKEWDEAISKSLTQHDKTSLDELRELANTVKHGDGGAARKLYKLNPKLFQNEWERTDPEDFGVVSHKPDVYAPMYGQDIYVQMEDIHRFRELVKRVWDHYLLAFTNPTSIR